MDESQDNQEEKDDAISVDDLNEAIASSPPEDEVSVRCAEYKAGWQRAMADYDNLKREMESQRISMAKYACAGLLTDLLPTIEALRKSVVHEPKPAEGQELPADIRQWVEGIRAVRQQLDTVLAKEGVTLIDEIGVPFDPHIHDAMLTRQVEGIEPDRVIEILEAGCKLHDRVVKPARVAVSE